MKTTIKLAPLDAALVIRADGILETWLPHIHDNPPRNAKAASALMCAYSDERLMSMITDAMDTAGYEYPGPAPESMRSAREPSRLQ